MINDTITRIRKLATRRDELLSKLERSIAIRDMWPDIEFPCSSWIAGSPSTEFLFYIESASGEIRTFTIDEMHLILADFHKEQVAYARRYSEKQI